MKPHECRDFTGALSAGNNIYRPVAFAPHASQTEWKICVHSMDIARVTARDRLVEDDAQHTESEDYMDTNGLLERYRAAEPAERRFLSSFDGVRAPAALFQRLAESDTAFGMLTGDFVASNVRRTADERLGTALDLFFTVRRAGFDCVLLRGYWSQNGDQRSAVLTYCRRDEEWMLRDLLAHICDEDHLGAFAWKGAGTSTVRVLARDREAEIGEVGGVLYGDIYAALGARHRDPRLLLDRLLLEGVFALQSVSTHAYVRALLKNQNG